MARSTPEQVEIYGQLAEEYGLPSVQKHAEAMTSPKRTVRPHSWPWSRRSTPARRRTGPTTDLPRADYGARGRGRRRGSTSWAEVAVLAGRACAGTACAGTACAGEGMRGR